MTPRLRHAFVWLSRIGHCRGFGIQSPTDYWFARYVLNEHWPYYKYQEVGPADDWLRRRVGRLCLRLANWRQPRVVTADDYREYFHAGCQASTFGDAVELVQMTLGAGSAGRLETVLASADDSTVLLLTGLQADRERWRRVVDDERAVITFDLYYCGVVMFDRRREKQNYIINF